MQWLYCVEEISEWVKENTAAGYFEQKFVLTKEDIERLQAGEIALLGGEYGALVCSEKRYDELLKSSLL